jgi:trimeric autotransporter adhesin
LTVYQWMLQYERIGDNVILNGGSAPLPLKLLQYTALLASGPSVAVDWTTVQEVNTNYFLVERSPDGQQFQVIDTVAATGQDGGGASYTATDAHPLTGSNYYRLVEVDKGGATTYFSILEVTVTAAQPASSLVISPNPASTVIWLSLSNAEEGPLHVSLTDMKGNVLQTWLFQKESPAWYQQVSLGNLPAGSYCIHVVGNRIGETQVFVKL